MTENHGLVGPSNMGTFRTCSLQRVLIMGKHGNTWEIADCCITNNFGPSIYLWDARPSQWVVHTPLAYAGFISVVTCSRTCYNSIVIIGLARLGCTNLAFPGNPSDPAHTFKVAGLTNLGQNGLDVSEPRCAISYIDCTIVQICAIDAIAGKQWVIY
jgi:hypothetical protein